MLRRGLIPGAADRFATTDALNGIIRCPEEPHRCYA